MWSLVQRKSIEKVKNTGLLNCSWFPNTVLRLSFHGGDLAKNISESTCHFIINVWCQYSQLVIIEMHVCLEWRRINKYWVERRSLLIGFGLRPSKIQIVYMCFTFTCKSCFMWKGSVLLHSDPSHQCTLEAGKYVTHRCAAQCRGVSNFPLSAKKAKVGTLTFWQKGKSLGHPTPCFVDSSAAWTRKMHFNNRTLFCTGLVWIAGLITGQ